MKVIKFLFRIFFVLLALLVIMWGLMFAYLQTETGQTWAYNSLIHYLEEATDTTISFNKIRVQFPLTIIIDKIAVSKENERLLTIRKLEISCSYSHILQGKIFIPRLYISDIDLYKTIEHDSNNSTLNENQALWTAPLMPFYIKFENIIVQNIHIVSTILEKFDLPNEMRILAEETRFNLQGVFTSNPFKEAISTHLLLTAKSEKKKNTLFTVGLDSQNHLLSLSLHTNQRLMSFLVPNFPNFIKSRLALYASAPTTTWQKMVDDVSSMDDAIEGHLKLSVIPQTDHLIPSPFHLLGDETVFKSRFQISRNWELKVFQLTADNQIFSLQPSQFLLRDFAIQNSEFNGSITDLKFFNELIGTHMAGPANFSGHLSGNLQTADLQLFLNADSLTIENQLIEAVKSNLTIQHNNAKWNGQTTINLIYAKEPLQISTLFDYSPDQFIKLSKLEVNAVDSKVEGEINCLLPNCRWNGFFHFDVEDLKPLARLLNTSLEGKITGTLTLNTSEASAEKKQDIQVQARGENLKGFDAEAKLLDLNLAIQSPLDNPQKLFYIESSAQVDQISYHNYFIEKGFFNGSQQFDFLSKSLSKVFQSYVIDNMHWEDGRIKLVKGTIYVDNPQEMLGGKLEADLQDIHVSNVDLEDLFLTTSMELNKNSPFQIKGKGFYSEPFWFEGAGTWQFDHILKEVVVVAQNFNGQWGPNPFKTLQTFNLHLDPNKTELKDLKFSWGNGILEGDFSLNGENLLARFQTNAISSELFHILYPEIPVNGFATIKAKIEGTVDQPKGKIEIGLRNVQWKEKLFAQNPSFGGVLFLDLSENGLNIESELKGIGHSPLIVKGRLPLIFSLKPFDVRMDEKQPIDVAVRAEGKLDPFLQLFSSDLSNLTGEVKIALKLAGQLKTPQLFGHVELLNATFESLNTGTIYRNIHALLEGDGTSIKLKDFKARDHKEGSITASGGISLDLANSFPFKFQIYPNKIHLLDADYAAIAGSGSLELIGNTKQSKLQGELTIDQAVVHLEQTLPSSLKNIEVTYFNIKEGETPPTLQKKSSSPAIDLAIKIKAPRNVKMEGNHIKSEWKGAIEITGTPDQPLLNGDLNIVQGEYDFNGKIFNLSQANIHFGGAPDKKTSLYVVATKEIDRIKADIIVKGSVTSPVISFRSNPPLPQREVLSYILFNRGISEITPDQGEQLTQSFVSLKGSEQTQGNGDDFLSRLRNNMGIDRLDFTSENDNKDIGLQIGKNVTENISISLANRSVVSLSPTFTIEAKLRKNFKLEAQTGLTQEAPIRLSLKWKKDY